MRKLLIFLFVAVIFLVGFMVGHFDQDATPSETQNKVLPGQDFYPRVFPVAKSMPLQQTTSNHAAIALPPEPLLKPPHFGFLLLAVLFLFCRWKSRQAVRVSEAAFANKQDRSNKYLARAAGKADYKVMPAVSRNLLKNPYGPEFNHLSFAERFDVAIRASGNRGRIVGVIYFHIVPLRNADGAAYAENLAVMMRLNLRSHDCVRVINEREIAVFISMLSNGNNLNKIATRLYETFHTFECAPPAPMLLQPGLAVYPMDGYSADDLVETALARTSKVNNLTISKWDDVQLQPVIRDILILAS